MIRPEFSISRVRRALQAVPRVGFLPVNQRALADVDEALPIECGQTISQPSLVAYMTEQLELKATSRVLEIGTGSGYQTAILAELAGEVFTVERIEQLASTAQERLAEIGYRNIHCRTGDGAAGWPDMAPFDAIIVTAAARTLPHALTTQLREGGRLIIPLGEPHGRQALWRVRKASDGTLRHTELIGVRFVPLVTAVD